MVFRYYSLFYYVSLGSFLLHFPCLFDILVFREEDAVESLLTVERFGNIGFDDGADEAPLDFEAGFVEGDIRFFSEVDDMFEE